MIKTIVKKPGLCLDRYISNAEQYVFCIVSHVEYNFTAT